MRDVFFHIGLYKTATTWFQRHLFPSLPGIRLIRTKRIDEIAAQLQAYAGLDDTVIVSEEALSETITEKRKPGHSAGKLARNLELIGALAPERGIIIAFREHASWLTAAYGQRAKKNAGLTHERYVGAFSAEDLSWCTKLDLIEQSCPRVFPLLYEELLREPKALTEELCRFIGKGVPADLDRLLLIRENPTPRSAAGHLLTRAILKLAGSHRRLVKRRAYRLGASVDRFFPHHPITIPPDLAAILEQDWNRLLDRVGERRGRDFSAYKSARHTS